MRARRARAYNKRSRTHSFTRYLKRILACGDPKVQGGHCATPCSRRAVHASLVKKKDRFAKITKTTPLAQHTLAGQAAARDAMAARSRAPGRGSAHSPRPSRRVHANVQVEVLCAHNGTQHQPKHKDTPHASEQPISGAFPRAHTRRDPCGHGSPIVRARPAPHKPHEHHIAQLCTMCGVTCCWLPHAAAHLHVCDALREHGIAARHTRARAASANAARAAASQRRRFAAQRTPAAFSRRALPSKLAMRLMND